MPIMEWPIATLVYYCAKCDNYFTLPGKCPCGNEREARAVINLYELRTVMQKFQTPEGIVNLLESFKAWVGKSD